MTPFTDYNTLQIHIHDLSLTAFQTAIIFDHQPEMLSQSLNHYH